MKNHRRLQDYLGEFVYGGIDGVVTTFAVVAGATGGGLTVSVILILGFANLIADGFSMSIGNYLSTKAEADKYHKEHGKYPTNQLPPFNTALATLLSFVIVGFMPLLMYVIQAAGIELSNQQLFIRTCIVTGVTFIMIGWMKSYVTQTNMVKSIGQTLLLGAIAAVLAYFVGDVLEHLISGV